MIWLTYLTTLIFLISFAMFLVQVVRTIIVTFQPSEEDDKAHISRFLQTASRQAKEITKGVLWLLLGCAAAALTQFLMFASK